MTSGDAVIRPARMVSTASIRLNITPLKRLATAPRVRPGRPRMRCGRRTPSADLPVFVGEAAELQAGARHVLGDKWRHEHLRGGEDPPLHHEEPREARIYTYTVFMYDISRDPVVRRR